MYIFSLVSFANVIFVKFIPLEQSTSVSIFDAAIVFLDVSHRCFLSALLLMGVRVVSRLELLQIMFQKAPGCLSVVHTFLLVV